jgi:Protein of unknown function (DUF2752)
VSQLGLARPRHRLWPAVAAPLASLGTAGTAVAYLAVVDPTAMRFRVACPFLAVTGHYCPGCGSVRAMDALLRGELGEAVGRNPLAVAVLPVVAALWFAWLRRHVTDAPRRVVAPGWMLWSFVGAVLVFWVLRNLPIGAALAP